MLRNPFFYRENVYILPFCGVKTSNVSERDIASDVAQGWVVLLGNILSGHGKFILL